MIWPQVSYPISVLSTKSLAQHLLHYHVLLAPQIHFIPIECLGEVAASSLWLSDLGVPPVAMGNLHSNSLK